MPGNRAALCLVPDEPRLERFRAAHPEVIILLRGAMPRAWVGGRKIARPTLRGLLDGWRRSSRRTTEAADGVLG
jgi:hypothetical protein